MTGDEDNPPTLDYASRGRILDTLDLQFWVTLGVLVFLLLTDLSCMALGVALLD
jgi:hypothetical protein